MKDEIQDLTEHMERYRATTLQVLDLIDQDDLSWRPSAEQYSLGQQLLHIAQTEDRFFRGIFEGDWSTDRIRFPEDLPDLPDLRAYFLRVRQVTLSKLREVDASQLGRTMEIPDGPPGHSLRSWLWFVLEHELHHRGQIWAYLRAMGRTPPFYAMPLPPGERPDIPARQELGGF